MLRLFIPDWLLPFFPLVVSEGKCVKDHSQLSFQLFKPESFLPDCGWGLSFEWPDLIVGLLPRSQLGSWEWISMLEKPFSLTEGYHWCWVVCILNLKLWSFPFLPVNQKANPWNFTPNTKRLHPLTLLRPSGWPGWLVGCSQTCSRVSSSWGSLTKHCPPRVPHIHTSTLPVWSHVCFLCHQPLFCTLLLEKLYCGKGHSRIPGGRY